MSGGPPRRTGAQIRMMSAPVTALLTADEMTGSRVASSAATMSGRGEVGMG